jgi:hypothetical protein
MKGDIERWREGEQFVRAASEYLGESIKNHTTPTSFKYNDATFTLTPTNNETIDAYSIKKDGTLLAFIAYATDATVYFRFKGGKAFKLEEGVGNIMTGGYRKRHGRRATRRRRSIRRRSIRRR